MKNIFLKTAFLLVSAFSYAQVGINTPTPDGSAALDIYSQNKGMLVPRLTTAKRDAIPNPATSLIIYDTDKKCLSQNIGTPTTPDWLCISGSAVRMFYMPSVSFDTSQNATGQTKDLYTLYKNQFGSPKAKSTSAPASIPFFPSSKDLYYYVTDADPNVFSNISISDSGVMTYNVKAAATDCSFINIVFVVK
ncbi:hypothetical protein C1637_15905 [Chryseobacterium lactis]|uniref:Uncharacterized protein n=1 Tax=Chryseobacterium lactis TaxID=1241981 RepID=A0A3G6RHB7_CHRLC|nr:hypothetical protein [Chryseobacterium lactis]AZA83975.1 hypothetical protein EG342_19735 [Chryseobacterium lactis]AZB04361.1 hypothetical protein EG341_10610 [Chryseobacterium lactis]PNW12532.1 hypothetical protein C1637_15905 [Chryseobacterium lactis]